MEYFKTTFELVYTVVKDIWKRLDYKLLTIWDLKIGYWLKTIYWFVVVPGFLQSVEDRFFFLTAEIDTILNIVISFLTNELILAKFNKPIFKRSHISCWVKYHLRFTGFGSWRFCKVPLSVEKRVCGVYSIFNSKCFTHKKKSVKRVELAKISSHWVLAEDRLL